MAAKLKAAGFDTYIKRYQTGLAIEHAAVSSL